MSNRSTRSRKNNGIGRTFTYYIPAPPQRKSGYREREFDKIMQGILSSGFEIEELHTESVDNGIFLIAILKAKSKKALMLDEHLDIQEKFKLKDSHLSPDFILETGDDEQ